MNVSDMLTEIRAHGFDDLDDTSLLGYLNDVYEDICALEPWPFLESTATATVDASTGKITAPTDIRAILTIEDTTNSRPLDPLRLDEFTRRYGNQLTQTGDPIVYYFIGSDIYVWPIPSSPTLTVRYLRLPAALTVTPDSAPILPRHHRLLVLGALVLCYMREDDSENAALFESKFDKRMERARNDFWNRQFDRTETIQDMDGTVNNGLIIDGWNTPDWLW